MAYLTMVYPTKAEELRWMRRIEYLAAQMTTENVPYHETYLGFLEALDNLSAFRNSDGYL
jgi:hypothetical protein